MKMGIVQAEVFFHKIFMRAAEIVAGSEEFQVVRSHNHTDIIQSGYRGRDWFKREFKHHKLHPAIEHVIRGHRYRPRDWHQLLLEWPHRSVTDYNRLAYTRDERAGEADKQTVTTLGKYLMRHFDMPDHEIRDVVALYTAAGDMRFIDNMDGILSALKRGPTSCMTADIEVRCLDGEVRHPYEVYDPALGWSLAVRDNNGSIDGRALVYKHHRDGSLSFVRSYKRCPNGGYSYADEVLEAWLKAQGVEKIDSWSEVGAHMMYYEVRGTFLMPYLDGCNHQVILGHVDGVMRVIADDDGTYDCDQTCGTAEDADCVECEDCGARHDEDDGYWVGPYEDRRVGPCCIDDYRYVVGRRGNQYYVHENDTVYVESQDEWYDDSYLDDNNIVRLANGEYEHIDNAVEVDGDWYHTDDDDITWDEYNERHQLVRDCVFTEDIGYVHKNYAWQCNHTSDWYSDAVEWVEFEGERYHPDHVPTNETNE